MSVIAPVADPLPELNPFRMVTIVNTPVANKPLNSDKSIETRTHFELLQTFANTTGSNDFFQPALLIQEQTSENTAYDTMISEDIVHVTEVATVNAKNAGTILLVLVALTVLAISTTTKNIFSPIGTAAIVVFALWGALVFGKDDESRKGRS